MTPRLLRFLKHAQTMGAIPGVPAQARWNQVQQLQQQMPEGQDPYSQWQQYNQQQMEQMKQQQQMELAERERQLLEEQHRTKQLNIESKLQAEKQKQQEAANKMLQASQQYKPGGPMNTLGNVINNAKNNLRTLPGRERQELPGYGLGKLLTRFREPGVKTMPITKQRGLQ